MVAIILLIRTDPAAISLTNPALGLNSGDAMSVRCSKAELIASKERTNAQHINSKHHSIEETENTKPKITTSRVEPRWISACGSFANCIMPLLAYPNAFLRNFK